MQRKHLVGIFLILTFFLPPTLRAASQGPIFYAKGTLAFAEKNYEQAYQYFKNSDRHLPHQPDTLYFLGITAIRLKKSEDVKKYWSQLLKEFPQYPEAKEIQNWLKHPQQSAPDKKWDIQSSASLFYDSNAIIEPDGSVLAAFQGHQSDLMGAFSLDLKYRIDLNQKSKFFIGYSGYQTTYANINFDINRLNYGRYQGKLEFQQTFDPKTVLKLPLNYSYITLGATRFLQSEAAEPRLEVLWNKSWFTVFRTQVKREDFFTVYGDVRDNWKTVDGVEQYYSLPQLKNAFVKWGYLYERSFATGNDWDYDNHRMITGFYTQLPNKFSILVDGDVTVRKKFSNIDTTYGIRRTDHGFNSGVTLSRELTKHINLGLSYFFTLNDSNVGQYSYKRHLTGLTLSTKL